MRLHSSGGSELGWYLCGIAAAAPVLIKHLVCILTYGRGPLRESYLVSIRSSAWNSLLDKDSPLTSQDG